MPEIDYGNLAAFKKMAEERTELTLKALGKPPEGVKQTETSYTTRDGCKNRVKLFQPTSPPKDGSPLIVMFHGGGFCIGAPEGEEQSCRSFVQAFGAVCVSAGYRLGPEFKFPYSINDAWDALQWAAKNAASFDADPSKGFIVGGTSAGGNISAVLSILARDEKLSPPLTGQYLSIPAVTPGKRWVPQKYQDMYLSMEQNAHGVPILPKAAVDMFMEGFAPDVESPLYNVLSNARGHANLPAAYFQVTGMDPLRDEAIIYEKMLREDNGLRTKLDMYPGLPHGFWGFFPSLKRSKDFRGDMVQGMGWLLGKKADVSKVDTDVAAAQV